METAPIAPPDNRPAAEQWAAQTEAFRSWLKEQLKSVPMTLHGIEVRAGIRGNALGKFLRGERGAVASLSPLQIKRLAPILRISEEQLLTRAGHLSHLPDRVTVDQAILGDPDLDYEDKRFLIDFYRRLKLARRAESGPASE